MLRPNRCEKDKTDLKSLDAHYNLCDREGFVLYWQVSKSSFQPSGIHGSLFTPGPYIVGIIQTNSNVTRMGKRCNEVFDFKKNL